VALSLYILHQKYILSSSRGYLACLLQTGAWVFPKKPTARESSEKV